MKEDAMNQPGPRRAPTPTPTGTAPAAMGNAAAVPAADFFGPGLVAWLRREIRTAVRAELSAGESPAALRVAAGYRTTVALARAARVKRAMLQRYEQRGAKFPGGRGADLAAIARCLNISPEKYAASVRRLWEITHYQEAEHDGSRDA